MTERVPLYVCKALDLTITEAAFQRQVEDLLRLCGWWVHHNADSRRADAGLLDIVALHPEQNRLLFAELKTEKGRLRKGRQQGEIVKGRKGRFRLIRHFEPGQAEWLDALRRIAGVEVYLWRTSDWRSIVGVVSDGRIVRD